MSKMKELVAKARLYARQLGFTAKGVALFDATGARLIDARIGPLNGYAEFLEYAQREGYLDPTGEPTRKGKLYRTKIQRAMRDRSAMRDLDAALKAKAEALTNGGIDPDGPLLRDLRKHAKTDEGLAAIAAMSKRDVAKAEQEPQPAKGKWPEKYDKPISRAVAELPKPDDAKRDYAAAVRNLVRLARGGHGFSDLKHWAAGHGFLLDSGKPFGPYQHQVKKVLRDNDAPINYSRKTPTTTPDDDPPTTPTPRKRRRSKSKSSTTTPATATPAPDSPAPSEVAALTHDAIARIPKGQLVDMLTQLLSSARKAQQRVDRPSRSSTSTKKASAS